MLIGVVAADPFPLSGNANLVEVLNHLGIRTGAKLVIDAGDYNSYPGSGQVVSDLSGSAFNLTLGVDATAENYDARFDGVAGRQSQAERFTMQIKQVGSNLYQQHLRLADQPAPAWVDAIHKDGARFAMAFWIWPRPNANGGMSYSNTLRGSTANVGFDFGTVDGSIIPGNGGKLTFFVSKGDPGGALAATVTTPAVVPSDQWVFIAIRVDEAAGTYMMQINETQYTGSITYSAPSSATGFAQIVFFASNVVGADGRLAQAVAWQGATIPANDDLMNLFQTTRVKFGK